MTNILEFQNNNMGTGFQFMGVLTQHEDGIGKVIDVVQGNSVWRIKALVTQAGHRIDHIDDRTGKQGHTK